MEKIKIVYLPLDERPCNYVFPVDLLQESQEFYIVRPEKSSLGFKKKPANFSKLLTFLLKETKEAKILIISIDMLLYGGIVPSRLHNLSIDMLKERFDTLKEIKKNNPLLKIYAFSLIMRCPSYSSNDEEPDYYETCGKEIFETGVLENKYNLGLISEDNYKEQLLNLNIKTKDYILDYKTRRAVNKKMNILTIKCLHQEIDYLVIPQDDSAVYGFTTMDRESIKKECPDFTNYFPGADEVGMTLLSRSICEYKQKKLKIYCDFAYEKGKDIIPLYEDRPFINTLKAQILNSGCEFVNSDSKIKNDFDIILFLYYPPDKQIEANDAYKKSNDFSILEDFRTCICNQVKSGKVCGLVDGAFANGGDIEFVQFISSKLSLFDISSYAGWNTSSNTLGTVIANCICNYFFGPNPLFLAKRYYEDIGYCSYVRKQVNEMLTNTKYNYFNVYEEKGYVSQIVEKELNYFMKTKLPEVYSKYKISECLLPWKRMFEVYIEVKNR